MIVDLVGDGHLGLGKRLENLFVRFAHFRLDVIEEQRECFASKLGHLLQFPFQRGHLLGTAVRHVQTRRQRIIEDDVVLFGCSDEAYNEVQRAFSVVNEVRRSIASWNGTYLLVKWSASSTVYNSLQ